jgi:hypothetical protein
MLKLNVKGEYCVKKILCVLFALCVLLPLVGCSDGIFVSDRSAKVSANYAHWNGKEYSPISGEYAEGKTIAKAKDGNWEINAVEQDPTHTFIVARSFLDQYLMVSNDYVVPTSGKLTAVSWNKTYITDPLFLEAVAKIEAGKTNSFTYETEGIFQLTDNQHMRAIYFAYENCPVATNYKGYMGKVNGEWVITTEISQDTHNEDGSPKPYSFSCYKIPNEYWDVLSEHFS